MPHIHSSSYGESRLRMLRVMRKGDRQDPKDHGNDTYYAAIHLNGSREASL